MSRPKWFWSDDQKPPSGEAWLMTIAPRPPESPGPRKRATQTLREFLWGEEEPSYRWRVG